MIVFGEILIGVIAFVSLYTAIFFIITLLEHRNDMIKPEKHLKNPFVCILIPCYNEESTLAKTVDSLFKLDYPKDKLDIIIVDDGSTDNTYKVAKKYLNQGVRVFRKKNEGKYSALNLGLSNTKAEFVGALDADSFVHPKALKRIIAYFDNPKVMAVTPSLRVYKPKTLIQRIQLVEYALSIFFRKMYSLIGSLHVTPGPLSIYRKAFFDKYGPYKKAHLTEDIEMALRIQSHDYLIENAVNAYVYTVSPQNFKDLYHQRKRWYNGFLRNIMDYKHLLLSKKHGNLGMYTLPLAFISIGLLIVSLSYVFYKVAKGARNTFLYAKAVDFDILRFDFNLDLFLVNINTVLILGVLTILVGVIIFILSVKFSQERDKIIFSYILYTITYAFFFGFWWLAVIFHNLAGRKVVWKPKKKIDKKTLA